MNYNKNLVKILIFGGLILMIFSNCDLWEEPGKIFEPEEEYSYGESPIINSIEPGDSAGAGINEIEIRGENFAPASDTSVVNLVYFDEMNVNVKSATSNEIVVYRPNIVSNSLTIKVATQNLHGVAKLSPYGITEVEIPLGQRNPDGEMIGEFYQKRQTFNAITTDEDGNLYIATHLILIKRTPDQSKTEVEIDRDFDDLTQMIFGPDGLIYGTIDDDVIFTIDPITGEEDEWAEIEDDAVSLDFDANGNLFAGGDGLYMVDTASNSHICSEYNDDYEISSLRVFDGYLYLALETPDGEKGIYRNKINEDGTLKATELYFNWTESAYSDYTITSITFDINGILYVGLKDHPSEPFILINSDGSAYPMYNNKDILSPIADHIVWGDGEYVFINKGKTIRVSGAAPPRIFKIKIGKSGAPYYGFQ
ncbi:MAG: IPT/TIG domain-containing protein [Candidatus Marinimicrobia bacterium]|nr:IPT/TIG domain-containing protein [Candidatus Neomarinimicrobiota bacterium]